MLTSQFELDPDPSSDALRAAVAAAMPATSGHYDELREGAELRAPWARFFSLLGAQGLADLDRRADQAARQVRLNGITHNVYADGDPASGADRPWPLRVLPLLVEPQEWAGIEAGVRQRAGLLDAMAADVYGPQRLLREGLLPPALVHGHPGYLRPLQGCDVPGGVRLHVVAFDLARAPDGRWCVVSQRTQAPSGLGYLLENRLIVSRLYPEAYRELRVQHLASAYRRMLDTLHNLAEPIARAAGDGTPQLALWTPGPYSETYFEHTYLARYLGLPLVEGADLSVRGERLYLKTVQGLQPVHGLLRRLDDAWCDPLELRPDSALGVPGLLQVLRAQQVVMANALGAGFLESPAVHGFLPAISQALLGEPLSLPTIETWWCGEPAVWERVRGELGDTVVRPAHHGADAGGPRDAVIVSTQPHAERVRLAARMAAQPEAYAVQRYLPFSQVPVWEDARLKPRSALLRAYAIADGAGGWQVLPGGMTRAATRDAYFVSMARGGVSLDTWVMTDGAVDTYSMLPQRLKPEALASHRWPVASRTAENLFWMGRYTERTEHLVRLALATADLIDDDDDAAPAVLEAVSSLAEASGLAPPGVPSLAQAPRVFERAVVAALGDVDGHSGATSIAYNLSAIARSANTLRDRLSTEHGRLVRAMREDFHRRVLRVSTVVPASAGFAATELLEALEHLAGQLAAVTGAQTDRMTRDDGWRLLTVGRLTERLIAMATTLREFVARRALEHAQGFDMLLTLFDSTITFRARHHGRQELLALLDLLVVDETNPRALACILRRLRTELGKLPPGSGSIDGLLAWLPQHGAGATLAELGTDLGDDGFAVDCERVVALCDRLADAGARLSDEIGRRYFALAAGAERHLYA